MKWGIRQNIVAMEPEGKICRLLSCKLKDNVEFMSAVNGFLLPRQNIQLSILIKMIILYLYCKRRKMECATHKPFYKMVKKGAVVEQKTEDSKLEI